jgi:hypothetical protein
VYYDRTENKISIAYSNQQDTLPLNVDFKDTNNKIYYTLSQFSLSSKYIVWCAPKEKIDTNKLIATFYEKSKILDIEIEI